jgi:MFS family permease
MQQPSASNQPVKDTVSKNDLILFWASFLTLIAAGIGFSVRGFIQADWGSQFGFTQTELGGISGGGLIGFGIAIIFFSFFSDLFGYGKIMLIGFSLHALSAVVTFAATPIYNAMGKDAAFVCLNVGMWLFALGNGTCEAVINPLTASMFKNNKTHWLNILHAGWPLGLILGAVIGIVFDVTGAKVAWEIKLGLFLLPVLAYGVMMFNRTFPRSEAKQAGVSVPSMMGTVGVLAFAVAALFLGLALPKLLGDLGVKGVPGYVGLIAGGVIWLAYAVYSKFAIGSFLLAVLYVLHALIGYVELGTDSWITLISGRVLNSDIIGKAAFIWTNLLMFGLRFTAGPIVHKTNPIGLLIFSAVMGVIGLYLLGLPANVGNIGLWIGALSIYAIGKTFYWPTLLGVISERFPKGGALALGLSGGIGMLCAGLIGGPGIGYKQDLAAVDKLMEKDDATYQRYAARHGEDDKGGKFKKGDLNKGGYPVVSEYAPNFLPMVAGLDNAKLKVFDDYHANYLKNEALKKEGKPELTAEGWKTTLDKDLDTLAKEKAAGKAVGEKLEQDLTGLKAWWEKDGKINYDMDWQPLEEARLYGAKQALTWTAFVPVGLAIGFVLLMFYFRFTGGYKQVVLEGEKH